jgi:nucleoside-diphosphate-sugar epimerase
MMVRLMTTDRPCNCVITGGVGSIGSQLADNLLEQGHKTTAIDNLSWGKKDFLARNLTNHDYTFIDLDLLDKQRVQEEFPTDVDIVFHLAAHSDTMRATVEPAIDFKTQPVRRSLCWT